MATQAKDEGTREIILIIADEYSFAESLKTCLAWGEFSNIKEY